MRLSVAVPLFVCAVVSPALACAQSSPVSTTLQSALQAMVGKDSIQDVTLSGTAETIAGSSDETTPFTYQATMAGSSRLEIPLSAGTLTEACLVASTGPSGQWSRGDGVIHTMAQHNLLAGLGWAFPAIVVSKLLTDTTMAASYVGLEGSLMHFSASGQLPGASQTAAALQQHLTHIDIWLDASTLLPAKLSFNTHPTNNAALDIPVSVEFSQYQAFGGVLLPSHVQKFLNNTLTLDLQMQSATFNSGLPPTTFTIQ